jgi:hypothetical protein
MKYLVAGVVLLSSCLPLAAQFDGPRAREGRGGPFGLWHQEVVTGAPYSAAVTNSKVQRLVDGSGAINTVEHTTTGQVARDSQGRTYEQTTIQGGRLGGNGSKTLIFIADPVAGYSYVLNDTEKTAVRRPFHARTEGESTEGQKPRLRDSANAVVSDLGQDNSTGLQAEGKSVTRTIPAGTIGNSAPIVSTVQRWYSPDLKLVVKSVRNDPQSGQSTYVLSNIVKGDPDASLFQVPAGYKVTDAPSRGFGHGRPRQ